MNTSDVDAACRSAFQLFFESLIDSGQTFSFPCDKSGEVWLDALSDGARNNYFFARSVVGHDYSSPVVIAVAAPATRTPAPRNEQTDIELSG